MENNTSELFDKINSEIKSAMISHDNLKRDCLRTVVSDIKNQTVNLGKTITDDVCIKVLQKSVKTHKDSIEQFNSAGRTELSEKETKELQVIESFLPKMFDEEMTKTAIDSLLSEKNIEKLKKNFGTIMKEISFSECSSQIDRRLASKYLNSILA